MFDWPSMRILYSTSAGVGRAVALAAKALVMEYDVTIVKKCENFLYYDSKTDSTA